MPGVLRSEYGEQHISRRGTPSRRPTVWGSGAACPQNGSLVPKRKTRLSACLSFWVPPPKGRLHLSVIKMLGANELPLCQGFRPTVWAPRSTRTYTISVIHMKRSDFRAPLSKSGPLIFSKPWTAGLFFFALPAGLRHGGWERPAVFTRHREEQPPGLP